MSRGGDALAGFLLSGFLLALLGAVLPAWGYHRDPAHFAAAGNYFLSLAIGIIASTRAAGLLPSLRGLSFLLVTGCVLGSLALLFLAAVTPPVPSDWWRVAVGLLALGCGAGLLNVALFHGISARFHSDAAATVTLGGIWYGLGCLAATLLVHYTVDTYTVPSILTFMAVVPALFAGIYAK